MSERKVAPVCAVNRNIAIQSGTRSEEQAPTEPPTRPLKDNLRRRDLGLLSAQEARFLRSGFVLSAGEMDFTWMEILEVRHPQSESGRMARLSNALTGAT